MKKLLKTRITNIRKLIKITENKSTENTTNYLIGYKDGYLSALKEELQVLTQLLGRYISQNEDNESIPIGFGKNSKPPVSTFTK